MSGGAAAPAMEIMLAMHRLWLFWSDSMCRELSLVPTDIREQRLCCLVPFNEIIPVMLGVEKRACAERLCWPYCEKRSSIEAFFSRRMFAVVPVRETSLSHHLACHVAVFRASGQSKSLALLLLNG